MKKTLQILTVLVLCWASAGCKRRGGDANGDATVIQNAGSDTMVNVAQTWAEDYSKEHPEVSVEVSGGGSGTGIAALINGTVDIANCSREMTPDEIERAKQQTGEAPKEFIVGYDALAIFVHKDNPLNEITIEQIAQIYAEGGNITKWSQLGVKVPGCGSDEIIRVSRQSNSGTYHYFREAVLGQGKDFRLGSRDLHGSKDVVELISTTACAIGYSGMGYGSPHVKALKVAAKKGEPAFAPSIETTLNKTYPIARPLLMYTRGTPTGPIADFMNWIMSQKGQEIVEESGYVPLQAAAKPQE